MASFQGVVELGSIGHVELGEHLGEVIVGRLGPVAAVQEGGYDLPSLGQYVLATLAGVQSGRAASPCVL